MERHPDDPDDLPATHAWRERVEAHLVDDKVAKDADKRDEFLWTRSRLAKAAKTTPSQMLKLLNGTTKSSPLVRVINNILGIRFIEPLPVDAEYADMVEMIMKIGDPDDLDWLKQAIAKASVPTPQSVTMAPVIPLHPPKNSH